MTRGSGHGAVACGFSQPLSTAEHMTVEVLFVRPWVTANIGADVQEYKHVDRACPSGQWIP